jgi:hypothetical protein
MQCSTPGAATDTTKPTQPPYLATQISVFPDVRGVSL